MDESQLKKYKADLEAINRFLIEKGVVLPEPFLVPFCNHVIMLLERLETKECASLDNQEMIQEIAPDSLALAKEFMAPLFQKYEVAPNRVEEALIAIYLQAAKAA